MSCCELLRQVGAGCQVAVVAATPVEAAPVEAALVDKTRLAVATKQFVIGSLVWDDQAAPAARQGPVVQAGSGVRVALAISGCDKANAAHAVTLLLECLAPRPSLVVQLGVAGALPAAQGMPGPQVGDVVVASREEYADTGSSSPSGWLSARDLGLPIAAPGGIELGGVFPLDTGLVRKAVKIIQEAVAPDLTLELHNVHNFPARDSGRAEEQLCETEEKLCSSRPQVQSSFRPAVWAGPCITSSTVTGTRRKALELAERFGALAESMEGAAAAHICALYGVPFLEIRGISNLVEDRNRQNWKIDLAAQIAGRATLAVLAAISS